MKAAEVTADEEAVITALAEAWNLFLELPVEHPSDLGEFLAIIHGAQDKVLARAGRRGLNSR
jgi:hypothetical protein